MTNYSLSGVNALIIEEEFLIALDIGFIIEEAGGKVLSLRTFEEARRMDGEWSRYQLAIVNPPDDSINEAEIARAMQLAGLRLVICSADIANDRVRLGLGAAPIVIKPFTAEDLLAACETALQD